MCMYVIYTYVWKYMYVCKAYPHTWHIHTYVCTSNINYLISLIIHLIIFLFVPLFCSLFGKINTCNGFYCDSFTPNSANKPKMWTENWSGWLVCVCVCLYTFLSFAMHKNTLENVFSGKLHSWTSICSWKFSYVI